MTDVNELGSAGASTGSPNNNAQDVPANGNNAGEASQNKQNAEETVPITQFKELEQKLGEQGKELGDYRNFFEEVTPILEILEKDPELTQSILDGKISSDLIKSLKEGEVSKQDAEKITKAHEDVKKDLGKEGYEKASKEEVESLVSEKLKTETAKISEDVNKRISEAEAKRDFQDSITEFINNTPDFAEYADAIQKWFDEHPDQSDISVAYKAVKADFLEERYKKEEEERNAEAAKEVAANAGGGSGQQTGNMNKEEVLDRLLGGNYKNPNVL